MVDFFKGLSMENIKKGFNPDYPDDEPTRDQVKELSGIVILEFGAPWCGYCKAAQPALKEVMTEYPEVGHIKVYDGKGKRLGRYFKVKLWPTLILLEDGKEAARTVRPSAREDIENLLGQTN